MKAAPTASRETMIRDRSSSRCSTSVASSLWPRRRGSRFMATGASLLRDFVVLARLRGRRRRRLGGRRGLRQLRLVIVIVVLAADGVLELAHPFAERLPDFRQALRTEEKQREQQQSGDLERADVRHQQQA